MNTSNLTEQQSYSQLKDKYDELVIELYGYALGLEQTSIFIDSGKSKDYVDGYDRARMCASINILEMLESDIEYIKAQCGMLGGEA